MKKFLVTLNILLPLMCFALPNDLSKQVVATSTAPAPIGTYSQAIKIGNIVFLSGQIPINPQTDELVTGVQQQIDQAFKNLAAVATAAGGSLNQIVKVNIYLIDLRNISLVNEVMAKYFSKPYPARSTVAVTSLAKGAAIEVEGIMVLNNSSK